MYKNKDLESIPDALRQGLNNHGAMIYLEQTSVDDNFTYHVESKNDLIPYDIPIDQRPQLFEEAYEQANSLTDEYPAGLMVQSSTYHEGIEYPQHHYEANDTLLDNHVRIYGEESLVLRMEHTPNGERHMVKFCGKETYPIEQEFVIMESVETVPPDIDVRKNNIEHGQKTQQIFQKMQQKYENIQTERGLDHGVMLGQQESIYDDGGYLCNIDGENIDIAGIDQQAVINHELNHYLSYTEKDISKIHALPDTVREPKQEEMTISAEDREILKKMLINETPSSSNKGLSKELDDDSPTI